MSTNQYFLYSDHRPLSRRIFFDEDAARAEAQAVARSCRGEIIHVAVIVDSVLEPLPDLKWESGAQPVTSVGLTGSSQVGEVGQLGRLSAPTPRNTYDDPAVRKNW